MNFQLQSQSAWQWHHPQKQQSRIAGASHKIAQRARSTDNGATPISSVLIFFSRYRALATVSCAFTGLIFQNRFETISFLTFWTANREITTSCAFLQLFLRSTFLWRPLGPPYLQKQWFVHFDFFTHKCTRSRIVPVCFCNLLFPPANCYCWLCGWHDSKIDHGRSSGTRKASEACKLTFVVTCAALKDSARWETSDPFRSCDGLKSTEGVL